MHLAVIMPRWVGDAVMATPALRSLRAHFPSARITGVMRPVIADLLAGTPWIDRVIAYDRHRRDSATGFTAAARALRADRPDAVAILPNSLSSAALAWRGGGRRRVGSAGEKLTRGQSSALRLVVMSLRVVDGIVEPDRKLDLRRPFRLVRDRLERGETLLDVAHGVVGAIGLRVARDQFIEKTLARGAPRLIPRAFPACRFGHHLALRPGRPPRSRRR